MDRYVGFYTSRPFWAGTELDLEDPRVIKDFTKLMSEEVHVYETNDYVLKVCKDGMFIFMLKDVCKKLNELKKKATPDFEYNATAWSTYLDHSNCIYLLFESAFMKHVNWGYFEISEITNKDAFGIWFKDGAFNGSSYTSESRMSQFLMGRFLQSYGYYALGLPLSADPRLSGRPEVPSVVFDTLHSEFAKVYADNTHIKVLAELAKSISEYKISNFATSLVLSWFIIEQYLISKWKTLLNNKNTSFPDGSKRINSERMKKFEGRDYSISVVLNILELFDVINFEQFKTIDELRDKRNKLIHRQEGTVCTHNDCQKAFEIIKSFVEYEIGIDLRLNTSYGLTGL